MAKSKLHPALSLIIDAKHHDPFTYLGLHACDNGHIFRAFQPYAQSMRIKTVQGWEPLLKQHPQGLWEWQGKLKPDSPCQLSIEVDSHSYETTDAYSFMPSITSDELYLLGEGKLKQSYKTLGAQTLTLQGVQGVRFAVWAPNAERVSVIGNFNRWDGRINPMRVHGSSGVWELFIPHLPAGELYKFEIRNRHTGNIHVKSDPYALEFEEKPGTAAKVQAPSNYQWQDNTWLEQRASNDWLHQPFNCYELHLGSWRRKENGRFLSYRELAAVLVPYLVDMGYTHVEMLPVSEHPLNESWGYQATGYFAVTNRFGTTDDFKYLVDACHQANIGVILDWVPGHFPKDDWALARYDGSALFEHEDPRLGEHQDWGTYIFNYGRNEVRNFLLASAHYWLNDLHIDGLRVDAVASMIYLDYSRKAGEWLPNKYGGRENLESIEFLKQLNVMTHEEFAGALTIAEESTAWPMVSRPVYLGGLGFSMKWNMGWMNDTLAYIENDPVHRRYHHNKLTFGQLYAYSENFVLPFSHDEVVHGKRSLLDKMPGDAWQKFANLRLLLTYQMTTPGKKLNFMGNEFGQGREWNVNAQLDWNLLTSEWHQGIQHANKDLNHLYRNIPALHELDFEHNGFSWVDCNDVDQSIISFLRFGLDGSFIVVILNFTPVPREGYRIGVPKSGYYKELFNSDASCYGGSNNGNWNGLSTIEESWMGFDYSLFINLPPLAGLILQIQ